MLLSFYYVIPYRKDFVNEHIRAIVVSGGKGLAFPRFTG